jgi:phosphoribosylglycinamide formyltransferase 1
VKEPLNVVAFASGSGTNFQALVDHVSADGDWRIVGLICNREDAGVLERALRAGIAATVIRTKDRDTAEVASETLAWLEAADADLICLAGYMRLIPAQVVARFPDRILNVHPALLPEFGGKGMYGMHVHRAAIEAGAKASGPTVHYVDEVYDRGAIVGQWPVQVRPDDTPESLAARVLEAEHRLYPIAVDHVCAALRRGVDPGPLVVPPGRGYGA